MIGSRALECELSRDHRPAFPFSADHHVVGDEDVLEEDLIEFMPAGQIMDRSDSYSGGRHVDNELREAAVPIFPGLAGSHERDQVMGMMCVRRPNLAAVDGPSAIPALRARPDGRQIGAGLGLAHPDSEETFASADSRKDGVLRALAPMREDLRAGLAVGDPVREAGRPRRQHFSRDDEADQSGLPPSTIFLGQVIPMKPEAPARRLKSASNELHEER